MSAERTDFLYPFLDAREQDAGPLLAALAASAEAKAQESAALWERSAAELLPALVAAASDMAERFARGGRLFCFGNGGSSTDAATVAALFSRPPFGPPLPARSLAADEAVVTALGNDVGFELVFSRQLIAHGRPGDIAFGISTSGNSDNVVRAFEEATARDILTVGLAGYDGGRMAACGFVRHCLVVRSDSVHRIQETQARLAFALWEEVSERLTAKGATPAGPGGRARDPHGNGGHGQP